MEEIKNRIERLRAAMKKHGFSAYLVPSADAHLGEYTPEKWKSRSWISGFTGSAGTVVVTEKEAGLWTDSRYFLQAGQQLEGTGIQLFKEGLPETPSIEQYLTKTLQAGQVVACDGKCYSHGEALAMEAHLDNFGIKFDVSEDLFGPDVWADRPSLPKGELFDQPVKYAGESAKDKINRVREALHGHGANSYIITMIDELAWVFNVRGRDVECNPVGVAYGFINDDKAVLFVLNEKIPQSLRTILEGQGIEIRPYEEAYEFVSKLPKESKVFVDGARTNEAFFRTVPKECRIVSGVSPIALMKAVKNETELNGVRAAMKRDGVALTRFFMWLESALDKGEKVTEVDIDRVLADFRAKQDLYYGDSFDTIAGYNDHGAIVHYRANDESAYEVKKSGTLLLDSGGQYYDGTTDITRTVSLDGNPSPEIKSDYTLVMKGHIAIATAKFIEGTRGNQIDILARKPLWDNGLHYGHGTGHGVGCFLNVHEGPQNIRMDNNPTEMLLNSITSNEPGVYRGGKWGIRIENLVRCQVVDETEFGRFFGFETLTLFYFDNNMIEKSMLTADEIAWYNAYQARVYETLSPMLEPHEAAWLKEKTKAI